MADELRDPSIHIRLSTLRRIFSSLGIPEDKAVQVVQRAYPYSLKGRLNVQQNAKTATKLERLVAAGEVDVSVFNGRLYAVRTELGHKGIQRIGPNEAAYATLRDIATDAQEFVDAYSLNRLEGYNTYIGLGIQLMGRKYALNKFKSYKERIFNRYEAFKVIDSDTDKDATKLFKQTWEQLLRQRTSVEMDIERDPERYVNMIYGRQDAEAAKASYRDWIGAQFEALAFLDHVPELSQLHGENALSRYERMQANKLIKKEAVTEDGKAQTYSSPEEEAYYKAMRGE
jgi:hypothetical protein